MEFLPQYAARAIVDLEIQIKRGKSKGFDKSHPYFFYSLKLVLDLLRSSVKVILPENGEVYRSNNAFLIDQIPSEDEAKSFSMPAPVTSFEYDFSYQSTADSTIEDFYKNRGIVYSNPKRRITLVVDWEQVFDSDPRKSGDEYKKLSLFSIVYEDKLGCWTLCDNTAILKKPIEFQSHDKTWGFLGCIVKHIDGKEVAHDSQLEMSYAGQWKPDLGAIVQFCHSIRAGAYLEERSEQSSTRRRKFRKLGVPDIIYHVLKIPGENYERRSLKGTHDSPRFHIRRAHIRRLSSGSLTFVRQCFVGEKEKGIVVKDYKYQPRSNMIH